METITRSVFSHTGSESVPLATVELEMICKTITIFLICVHATQLADRLTLAPRV